MSIFQRIAAWFASIFAFFAALFGGGGGKAPVTFSDALVGAYTVQEKVQIDLSAVTVPGGTFNRLSLAYTASAPLQAEFSYRDSNRKTKTQTFFLSEQWSEFSLLIENALTGATAVKALSLSLLPLHGVAGNLTVTAASLDMQTMPKQSVVFLENHRLKIGVNLAWGGGLSVLTDKQCPRSDLPNLLNNHDTGRLVQQSYYGAQKIAGYTNGIYQEQTWPYNPVQGGDVYNNRSQLVALEITKDTVKVRCRPLDWALKNAQTPAYFTSTYHLTDHCVAVENEYIDFSNYNAIVRDQELPAFYTVSALHRFVHYAGDRPWTGDALSYEDHLGFWGTDPACRFTVDQKNTENWCAWVDDADYGVGLWTPLAQYFLAGKFSYDGSTNADAAATNYVAPLRKFKIRYNTPFLYTYYLTAGTTAQIRDAFASMR